MCMFLTFHKTLWLKSHFPQTMKKKHAPF